MIRASRIQAKAGSIVGLPFLMLTVLLLQIAASSPAKETVVLTFQEFESSCIDLGRYDEKAKQLTVRFVNRHRERFYRYSNVPAEVWRKLNVLNETGGVGEYLNETIVQDPATYPFKELTIRAYKTIPKSKKP